MRQFGPVISILLLLCHAASKTMAGQPQWTPTPPRLVIVLVNGTNLSDWLKSDSQPFQDLMHRGTMGLMNTKCLGSLNSANACATIGAGNYFSADPSRIGTGPISNLGRILWINRVSIQCIGESNPILGIEQRFHRHERGRVWVVSEYQESVLRRVLLHVDEDATNFIFLTPLPRDSDQRLSPILVVGKGFQRGVLTSTSTRWPGIVCNVDIAPTILSIFNIPMGEARDAGMIGTTIRSVPTKNPLNHIKHLDRWSASMHASLPRVYTSFGLVEGLLVLISIAGCVATRWKSKAILRVGKFLVTTALLLPLMMIPVGWWKFASSGTCEQATVWLSVGLAAVCALSLAFWQRSTSFWVMIGALILCADLVLHFSRYSPFAFSLVSGSRFYGMGNEHTALLVAFLLLWVGLGAEEEGRWVTVAKAVLCVLAVALLSNSSFGANFGGSLTAAAALGTAVIGMSCTKWTWKQTVVMLAFIAFTVGLNLMDVTRSPHIQSHIGRTYGMALDHGFQSVVEVASRKLAMNWRFMTETPISFLALVIMALATWCIHRPFPLLKELFDARPRLQRALWGAPVGMLVGFLANDSGIVVLVMMLVVYVPAILGLIIEERLCNAA